MVYVLDHKNGETFSYISKPLDGDISKVKIATAVTDGGKFPGGGGFLLNGIWWETTYLPTKIKLGGRKRKLTDLYYVGFTWLVDDKFKTIVEELEPGVHQFVPVELLWNNGEHAASKYCFAPGNRIDSVHDEQTTIPRRANGWLIQGDGGKFVFSNAKVGNRHVWIDMMFGPQVAYNVSDELVRRLQEAGVTGFTAIEAPSA